MKRVILLAVFSILVVFATGLRAQYTSPLPYPVIPRDSVVPTPYAPVNYQRPVAQPQQSVASPVTTLPPAFASADTARTVRVQGNSDIGTIIPLTLPGYELRVMDVTKKITFDINGSPVIAEVPLFIYMPRSSASIQDSAKELRKIYNDLIMLYDQDRVDKERVRSMLKRMDGIIDSFDSITPVVAKHTSAAY